MYFTRTTLHTHNRSIITTPNPNCLTFFVKYSVFDVWSCMMCSKHHQCCWKYMIFRAKTKVLFQKSLLNSAKKGVFNTHGIKPRGKLLLCILLLVPGRYKCRKGSSTISKIHLTHWKKHQPLVIFSIKEYCLCSTTYMNFAQLFALICVKMGDYHSNHGVRKHSCSILNI